MNRHTYMCVSKYKPTTTHNITTKLKNKQTYQKKTWYQTNERTNKRSIGVGVKQKSKSGERGTELTTIRRNYKLYLFSYQKSRIEKNKTIFIFICSATGIVLLNWPPSHTKVQFCSGGSLIHIEFALHILIVLFHMTIKTISIW